jgi:hypothetical protein
MKLLPLPVAWLRIRLALSRWQPVAVVSALLILAALVSLAWLAQANRLLRGEEELARRMAALPPAQVKAPPPGANENLAAFYAALGERRYAEQQVKTLFGLAAKSGLVLRQGEYKAGYDRNARVHTYQVTLPVSGSYRAIWQFALQALRAIPFASLDEISFRRDGIADANVEARLRLTLYLADSPGAEP